MAEATKTTLNKKTLSTWSENSRSNLNPNVGSKIKISKNLLQGFLGIAFMTMWLILSVNNDQLLLGEIIPAYIIITALLFMRALDESNS